MFTITARPTFRRDVTIHTPDGDGFKQESVKATYRVLPADEIEKHNLDTAAGTSDFLRAAIVRLDDVADANGQTIEYSEQLLEQAIAWPHVRMALSMTYFEEIAKARVGN